MHKFKHTYTKKETFFLFNALINATETHLTLYKIEKAIPPLALISKCNNFESWKDIIESY